MANVQRTPSGKWECRWSWYAQDGTRREQRKTFSKKADAEQHARDVENRHSTGQSVDHNPGRLPLDVWAERWFRSLEGKKKASTLRGYRQILDQSVKPALGQRQVIGITTWDVEQFIEHLSATGKAAPTVKRHYGVLRSALKYAARHKAIPVNPCIGAELPADHRTDRPAPATLNPQQVAALAEHLDATEPYGLMIRFMAYTGLRAGEVSGLHIGDLDLLRRRLYVRRSRIKIKGGWEVTTPKNGKERIVKMPQWLCDRLAAYLAQHPHRADRDHPLWPGRTNGGQARFEHAPGSLDWGKPWDRDAFYKRQFRPALEACGLPPMRLHDLRHTAASLMLTAGIDRFEVAKALGHSMQVLETIYAHLIDDGTNVMDRMPEPALHTTA